MKNHEEGCKSEGRIYLEQLLNETVKIKISDGRCLIGNFLCTDKEMNVIIGACQEYVKEPDVNHPEEPRLLGLAMIPGKHIMSIAIDNTPCGQTTSSRLSL